jgi:hypothetical protein
MEDLTFEQFAQFIREYWHVSRRKPIGPETQFERDLGLMGDDGDDLLEEVAKRYEIEFTEETFDLKPNEQLFHDEASVLFLGPLAMKNLLSLDPSPDAREIRPFTVGELYKAVLKELSKKSQAPS